MASSRMRRHRRMMALSLTSVLVLVACGDDAPTTSTTPSATDGTDATTHEVTATDYAFSGIPAEMAAGSTITFKNDSTVEVHEVVAFNVGDDDRPAMEILAGFESEPPAAPPALVIVQGPGGEPSITPIGDGQLTEPGRYLFLCAIQQGVEPGAYFAEAQRMQEAGEEGPVNIEGAGPPHFTLGMVTEATVS